LQNWYGNSKSHINFVLPKYEQMVNPENEAFLQLITTADGSKTIYNGQVGEHYHSIHGALQESRHVFLESGLKYFLEQNDQDTVSILEAGFGTGLNFLLSATYCRQNKISLRYTGIEAYPLSPNLIRQCAYRQFVNDEIWDSFISNYDQSFRQEVSFDPFIRLELIQQKLSGFNSSRLFDILYFDAFAAAKQPEMWTLQSLGHICHFLRPGGVFVTYAMNGNLKRNMKALGFRPEKVPGAAGKREMLRATLNG
jgi:tRNA U34 5-methylaminomethyl-2-thiouridine-forming methyltransferase MnmC